VEITDLLVRAGQLMLVGMVVVFAFLGLLIWATKLMSALVLEYHVEATPTAANNTPSQAALPRTQSGVAPQTVAAISAAIHQYRQSKK
jgi:oxaloacetate decarboxylase gamma subunit